MTPPASPRPASPRPTPTPRSLPLPLPVLIAPAAASTLLALAPIRRPFAAATVGWALSMPAVELPVHVGAYVGAMVTPAWVRRLGQGRDQNRGHQRDSGRTADLLGGAMAAATCAGLRVLVARQLAVAPDRKSVV